MNRTINRGEKTLFTCKRCGKCCSSGPNVALTPMDICRISRFLKTSWRDLVGRFFYVIIADQIPVIILRGVGDKCVFLERERGLASCRVYPARPIRCRLYPFIPIAPGVKNTLEISMSCPGVGEGEVIDPPWSELEVFIDEVKRQYAKLYKYIFEEGLTPLQALERIIDEECSGLD